MTDMMNCVDKLLEKKITGYKQRVDVNRYGVYRYKSAARCLCHTRRGPRANMRDL